MRNKNIINYFLYVFITYILYSNRLFSKEVKKKKKNVKAPTSSKLFFTSSPSPEGDFVMVIGKRKSGN